MLKKLVKNWLPPALLKWRRRSRNGTIEYVGSYPSWTEAEKAATGYDSDLILEKVTAAVLKVQAGEAAYERDSVLFDRLEFPFPLLAGLLRSAAENGGKLTVIDFGGSLGSTYYQCREFLRGLTELKWCVIEQPRFVQRGRNKFESDQLRFYFSLQECMQVTKPDVILFAGVLPYLPTPQQVLGEAMETGVKYIIVDRTQLSEAGSDSLCVQYVPSTIYSASYPCWILSESRLREMLSGRQYELVADFDALGGEGTVVGGPPFKFRGAIFERSL